MRTTVSVVGLASANFDHTITINGVPAFTSIGPDGITFSNSVPINNIDANIIEVDATGYDGSSATTRETAYQYEVLAMHLEGTEWFSDAERSWVQYSSKDWDPSHGDSDHLHYYGIFSDLGPQTYDFDEPCSFACNSPSGGDVCLNLSFDTYGAFEGDWVESDAFGTGMGSINSQFTIIKRASADEEQLVVFHFTSLQYSLCLDPMDFDPSTITFRGAPGFWYIKDGQTNGVAFLIRVQTNTPFTIQESDFQFPGENRITAKGILVAASTSSSSPASAITLFPWQG